MEFVSYDIETNDFRRAGAASRSIKEHLKRIGADAEAIRRTMIAAYEAEMNVVIHSVGGRLEASLSDTQIDVNVVDGGPGIPDIELAMTEGFSTASAEARALGFGAGMGLPNIRRNSDRLRVTSRGDEGTRVSFTVYLKPEDTAAPRIISLYASADRCRDCRACLVACPTQAMRVRMGRPSVLEHLCVDCTACIGSCAPRALTIRDEVSSLEDVTTKDGMVLAVPPALLAGCGSAYPPAQVLAALRTLGFADVVTVAPFERALREAALAAAQTPATAGAASEASGTSGAVATAAQTPATAGAAAGITPAPAGTPAPSSPRRGPLIVPSCPAVVNLIELRFPSLVPQLVAFESPWEALHAAYADRPVAYVVSCPSQRSALLSHDQNGPDRSGMTGSSGPARAEYLAPEVIRQAVMMRLTGHGGDGSAVDPGAVGDGRDAATGGTSAPAAIAPAAPASAAPLASDDLLPVTGMSHVIAVLEQIENGMLEDVAVIDPYACEGGCFGSPLLFEDHHVACRRWDQGRAPVEADGAVRAASGATRPATAAARRRPYAARPGIRLDADMSRAIEKLGRLQAVIRTLPGRDCGACGAPTCAALAEDVVMERAGVDLCPYAGGEKEDPDR